MAQQHEYQLAEQYFRNGEYEKAAELYEKIWQRQPGNYLVYQNYVKSLVELKQFDRAERVVQKQIKTNPNDLSYFVDMGMLHRWQGNEKAASEQFQKALDRITTNTQQINRLANRFQTFGLWDYALMTYTTARKLFHANQSDLFLFEIASVYRKQGNWLAAIQTYLDVLMFNPSQDEFVQAQLVTLMDAPALSRQLQLEINRRLQKHPDHEVLNQLLVWYLMQVQQWEAAFEQVRALDRRRREDGHRLYQFAQAAMDAGQYDVALAAYQVIVTEKGRSSAWYLPARSAELETEKIKLRVAAHPDSAAVHRLQQRYEAYLTEFGKTSRTLNVVRDYASFQVRYLRNPMKAIALLEEVLTLLTADQNIIGKIKLDIGDYWLIVDEPWEAMLRYGQVDKAFKDEPLGEEARYKNARLSFYMGDFPWAQAQLNVLKSATSELVANDALALSVFLTDNLGLDTTPEPMKLFARADLLLFQYRYADALACLDSILLQYPGHSLHDDVLMEKGKIYIAQHRYDLAIQEFEQIHTNYSYDLLGDDALFRLAEIYEHHVRDTQRAMDLYEQLLVRYKGSLYTVEARKRFRALRGDWTN